MKPWRACGDSHILSHSLVNIVAMFESWLTYYNCMQHVRVSSALDCVSGFNFYAIDRNCVRTVCESISMRKIPCMQDGNFTHCKYIAQCEAKWSMLIDHWIFQQWSPPSQLTKMMDNPHNFYSLIEPHRCGLLMVITGWLVTSVFTPIVNHLYMWFQQKHPGRG